MDSIAVLGVPVHAVTVEDFIEMVIRRAKGKTRSVITYVNAHCLNVSVEHESYRRVLLEADLVYADGMAVVWAARMLGERLPERVNAGDFIPAFCRRCAEEGISVYLLGSKAEESAGAARAFVAAAPGLRIAGHHDGYFSEAETAEVIDEVNRSGADVLLVGMGVPRQELFVAQNREALQVPVCWCVGALFEYYSGSRARAPAWMRRCGFEWLFRLVLEPRRMWRRYLVGNVRFVRGVLRERRQIGRKGGGDRAAHV